MEGRGGQCCAACAPTHPECGGFTYNRTQARCYFLPRASVGGDVGAAGPRLRRRPAGDCVSYLNRGVDRPARGNRSALPPIPGLGGTKAVAPSPVVAPQAMRMVETTCSQSVCRGVVWEEYPSLLDIYAATLTANDPGAGELCGRFAEYARRSNPAPVSDSSWEEPKLIG
jgi:hypothetical protein